MISSIIFISGDHPICKACYSVTCSLCSILIDTSEFWDWGLELIAKDQKCKDCGRLKLCSACSIWKNEHTEFSFNYRSNGKRCRICVDECNPVRANPPDIMICPKCRRTREKDSSFPTDASKVNNLCFLCRALTMSKKCLRFVSPLNLFVITSFP